MTPDVVRTKWGFVTPQGMWRLKEALDLAAAAGADGFEIDGHPWESRFAAYLLEFCRNEGLAPVKGSGDEPIFTDTITAARSVEPLIGLVKAHLDEITGVVVESDGTLHLQKDSKIVAAITWPDILPDVDALAKGQTH
jgi:sugar phosphate isomerase/epimerase